MTRMATITALLLATAALGGYPQDVAAARADYATRYALGEDPRYLWTGNLAPEMRTQAAIAQAFWLPHLSLSSVLEHQVPEQVTPTLWRIDLNLLGWKRAAWFKVAKEYPYTQVLPAYLHDPLIVRADWLIAVTSDASLSQLYYDLLYAQVGTPKNRAEWLKVHDVSAKQQKTRTAIVLDKGRSGVAKETRVVLEAGDGIHWETLDSADATGKQDPLEQLEGGLKFDAQELIARVKKVHVESGERTFVQAYFLLNGKGAKQDEAPTKIVEDRTHFRGNFAIRTPGSCVSCHLPLNGPAHNALRDRIAAGVEVKSNDRVFVEQTYLAKQATLIERAGEDFELFTSLACGCSPAQAVSAFRNVVHFYDANVTLEQAAREVYARDAEELRLAMGYYSELTGPADGAARFGDLPSGIAIPRRSWEGDIKNKKPGVFHRALEAVQIYRSKK